MPPTATHEVFVAAVRQSGALDFAQMKQLMALQKTCPDAKSLATESVRKGLLTAFQAKALYQGQSLVLGPYVLLDQIGEGGMGAVYKARQMTLNRVVALKIIRKERLQNEKTVKRFQREIQAASKLNHPNIVKAFGADESGGILLFAMEYVEGTDLSKLVKEKGPLPIAQACDYIRQVALGLQHAHEQSLVHRDIKGQNLLLSKDGVVKLLDLGLARQVDVTDQTTLTQEGSVLGTPDFLAPEQAISAHTADIRADIYSLGVTFYFLLTGQVPFPGGSLAEKILKHQVEEPEAVEKLRPDCPKQVAATVRKMMAKKVGKRYQTPKQVAADLADLLRKGKLPTSAVRRSATPTQQALMDTATDKKQGMRTPPLEQDRTKVGMNQPLARRRLLLIGSGLCGVMAFLAVISCFIIPFGTSSIASNSLVGSNKSTSVETKQAAQGKYKFEQEYNLKNLSSIQSDWVFAGTWELRPEGLVVFNQNATPSTATTKKRFRGDMEIEASFSIVQGNNIDIVIAGQPINVVTPPIKGHRFVAIKRGTTLTINVNGKESVRVVDESKTNLFAIIFRSPGGPGYFSSGHCLMEKLSVKAQAAE